MTTSVAVNAAKGPTVQAPRPALKFKPTSAAVYLSVVLGFVLLGAINYQSNAAYIVIALVTSTAAMSLIHAWRNISTVRLTAGQAFPAFAGEPLRAKVKLTAGSTACVALVCDAPEIPEDDGVTVEHLAVRQAHDLTLVLPGKSRGLHQVRRLRIASIYPLGLLYVQAEIIIDWQFIVYPTPVAGGEVMVDAGEGQADGQFIAATGDFHGHRHYQLGESQRRVDWRAVARGRTMLVKEFVSGAKQDCWIDFDRFLGVPLEPRLSLMSGQIVAFEQAGQRYGLRLPGIVVEPNHGDEHYHTCLAHLAAWTSEPRVTNS